ncbi:cytochrome P450 4g15-like [Nylanderia fulva]|uniref:cytochrome P450 4g15-like n=1 Tax=Nylanderia fulva TaxID=613905 RepID=UPI0010FB4047|nr:cytochrome P450 4g15-like [Nylanderia fulva]
MARYRLGNEVKGNRYWEKEEDRKCRICGRRLETWEHVWEECMDWGKEESWQEMIKVYTELLEIYGTKTPQSAPIKYEHLQHMDYLNRVIKETLRIFPTIPLFSRQLTEDLEMEEFILPKGANVVIELLTLHRNEKFWSKPLVFDPDSFLPQNIGTSYQHYYMPFSMGPRNCIGMQYAIMSMKVILATLIRTFIFKVEKSIQIDKIKLTVDLILSTVEPLKIKIAKRDMH